MKPRTNAARPLKGRLRLICSCIVFAAALQPLACGAGAPDDFVAGELIRLNDNGAWSWFMDPRAIVDDGKLIVGSVRAVDTYDAGQNDPDWGNVEVAVLNIASGKTGRTVLHQQFEQDDHDGPVFLALPDGRYLAMYTKHGNERKIHYRFSRPGDPLAWGEDHVFVTPEREGAPPREDYVTYASKDNVTYSNLFRTLDGRIYDFFRGVHYDPNYMVSDDNGRSWTYGGRLLLGKGGYSPYPRYAFDGKETVHFIVTEDHPRNFDNSIYHAFVRDGQLYFSDGKPAARLSESTEPSLAAWDLTRVFQGDPDNVAWTVDIELDDKARPYIVFSVQKDGRGRPRGEGGMDLRYYYGRWDGSRWRVHEMAYAGVRLYPGEDDYPGLAALDPNDPNTVYISTNAEPSTGEPLVSTADHRRHYELFRGVTADDGATWRWTPITANSTTDNLRPIVPKWNDPRTALVWMRGKYFANHGQWDTAVVGLVLPPKGATKAPEAEPHEE